MAKKTTPKKDFSQVAKSVVDLLTDKHLIGTGGQVLPKTKKAAKKKA